MFEIITWLLLLLVKIILGVFVAFLSIHICRGVISYVRLSHLRDQNIKTFFRPFFGWFYYLIPSSKEWDQFAPLKRFLEDNKDQKVIAINNLLFVDPTILILDEDLAKDFISYESDYAMRMPLPKGINVGFFFEHGPKVIQARANYAEFFNNEFLSSLTPRLCRIMRDTYRQFADNMLSKDEFTRIDVAGLLEETFSRVVSSVLFGEEKCDLDGVPLPKRIRKSIREQVDLYVSPLNIFLLNIPVMFGLLPSQTKIVRERNMIKEFCWELFQERLKKGPKPQPNLLDMMVRLNQKNISEGRAPLTKDEVAGHIILFQFAGEDTSLLTTSNALIHMGKDAKTKDYVTRVVDDLWKGKSSSDTLSYQDIYNNQEFQLILKEFLRLGAPFPFLVPRRLTKDIKLGPYNLKKGDMINVLGAVGHTYSKFFENPLEFDPTRHDDQHKKSIKKGALVPFGHGPRNCIGRVLGDAMVSLQIASLLNVFDFKQDTERVQRKVYKALYGFGDCTILMKKRS